MTDNLLLPVCLDRVLDSNGDPVSGAKVNVYDAETTDFKNVFTDAALTVAAANPIIADSGGYLDARYIGIGDYKLVTTTSANVTIKTEDNLPGALDTSTFAANEAIPITPVISKTTAYTVVVGDKGNVIDADPTGGSFSITLPPPATAADNFLITVKHTGSTNAVTIEGVGPELPYVLNYENEAVTLTCDGAKWLITEDGRVYRPALTVTPQGYLTALSATPIIVSDVASATTVYYTPFVGFLVPIYNGNRFVPTEFQELSLTLVAQHEASEIYDVFGFFDASTLRIGTGPKWTTSAAGAGDRGTGASTTEIERLNGLFVNSVDITLRNGTTTYSVDANKATYLGSIFIDTVAGQITCHVSSGQSRKFGVWNAYNRQEIVLLVVDPTASWTYSTGAFRPSNNDPTNSATVLSGLPEERFNIKFEQTMTATASTDDGRIGIGHDSTTVLSGKYGRANLAISAATPTSYSSDMGSTYIAVPQIGISVMTALEYGGDSDVSFRGGQEDMQLIANWRG